MKHKWTGPVDDRTCKNCGVRRKTINSIFKYKQWWGGWSHEYPKCGPLDEQKEAWKRGRERAEFEHQVKMLIDILADAHKAINAALAINLDDKDAAVKMADILSSHNRES
jgi:hypothetical protein